MSSAYEAFLTTSINDQPLQEHRSIQPSFLRLLNMSIQKDDRVYIEHALRVLKSGRPVVVYDLETTGLDDLDVPEPPRIWAIAAIKRAPGGIREEKQTIINCGMPIPEAANLKKIDPEFPLKFGVDERSALLDFENFIRDCLLAGHNILKFDNGVIRKRYHHLGLQIPYQLIDERWNIDTLVLAKAMFGQTYQTGAPSSYSLSKLADFLGVSVDETDLHDALNDARLCEKVLQLLALRARTMNLDA